MNKTISPLTYKIVALEALQETDINESVDWALDMMQLGFKSPALFALAGFSKPVNYFETIACLKEALQELKLELKQGEAAIVSYASYYIHQISNQQNIRANLTQLFKFCQDIGYEASVYNFYLLYWAWDDLDYEENEHNNYWEGATRQNIQTIVIQQAQQWLEQYKTKYTQPNIQPR